MRPRALAVFIGDADNESGAGVDFAFQISYRHTHRDRHTHRKRLTHTETHTQTDTGTHISQAYLGCDMETSVVCLLDVLAL